jgi:hypothetical protein
VDVERATVREGEGAAPGPRRARDWALRYGWALWAAIVLAGSVVPVEWVFGFAPSDQWSWMAGLAHFLEFGIFAVLVTLALRGRRRWRAGLVAGITAAIVYGVVIELVQAPLSYRSADPRDVAFDVLGVATAALLLSWGRRRRGRRTGHRG